MCFLPEQSSHHKKPGEKQTPPPNTECKKGRCSLYWPYYREASRTWLCLAQQPHPGLSTSTSNTTKQRRWKCALEQQSPTSPGGACSIHFKKFGAVVWDAECLHCSMVVAVPSLMTQCGLGSDCLNPHVTVILWAEFSGSIRRFKGYPTYFQKSFC